MIYCLGKLQKSYTDYKAEDSILVADILGEYNMPIDETVIRFESCGLNTKAEWYCLYSKYIADYIVASVIEKP